MLSGNNKHSGINSIVRIEAVSLAAIPAYFNHELIQKELQPHLSEDGSKISVNLDTVGLLKELEVVALFTIKYISRTPNQKKIYLSSRFKAIKKLAETSIKSETNTVYIAELNLYLTNFICELENYFQVYLVLKFLDVDKFMQEVAGVMAIVNSEAASEKFSVLYDKCYKSYSNINAITMQLVNSVPDTCYKESEQLIAEVAKTLPKLYLEIFDEFLAFNNYSIPYLSKSQIDKHRNHIATLKDNDALAATITFFSNLLLSQMAIYKIVDDRHNKLLSSQPATQVDASISNLLIKPSSNFKDQNDIVDELMDLNKIEILLNTLNLLQGNMRTKNVLLCGVKFKRISAILAYAIQGLKNKVAPRLPPETDEQEALQDLECQPINLDDTGVDFVMLDQIPANMQRTSTEPTIHKKSTRKKKGLTEEKVAATEPTREKKETIKTKPLYRCTQ